MPLATGTSLGRYEIVGLLGAGGMGEVYRARDQRLQRTVAIKILPPSFSRDPERLRRFEHEARAAGSLNHPNIVAVYDVGADELSPYIVTEFLEGQTLRDKLVSQISIERSIDYATQIAKGLAAAHAKGIWHRDLKPENVWVTTDGRAKILDFGLAKSTASVASDGATMTSLQEDGSTPGTVLGTVGYMSPEQVLGKPVDGRSDIFSFGSILYEMLAGRRAFQHGSVVETMHAIVHEELPKRSDLAPRVPVALLGVVCRCLAKEADERFQSASDLAFALSNCVAGEGPEPGIAPPAATRRNLERLPWSAGLVLLLAAVISLGVAYTRLTPQPVQIVRAQLLPPPDSLFSRYQFAASPDGTRVAFVAVDTDGNAALWLRALALSASDAQPLKGTKGAASPFWSPDSQRIAFFADGKLQAVNVRDGSVETLGQAESRRGGSWNREGTILFPPSPAGPLYRISDTGGVAMPVTRIQQGRGEGHTYPFFLPDGKRFLYFARSDDPQSNGIYIGSLDSSVPIRVPLGLAENAAFASGHLIFVRGRSLMAQPFDLDRLEPTGPAVPIAEGVEPDVGGRPEFSVSQTGVLVFQSEADAPSRLVWFDGSGKELGTLPGVGFKYPRFSPDGRSLAVSSDDAGDGRYYIRIYDLTSGISTRLTNGGSDLSPVWTNDGKQISYASTDGNIRYLYTIAADGSAPPQILLKGARMVPNDWSRNGDLVFMDFANGAPRLAVYSASDHSVAPLGGESEAQFSPDANWIVYSGPRGLLSGEIFVQPVRGPSRRRQISNAGGGQPRWSHDGKRIFYLAPDKKLMAVTFDPQNMTATTPQPLFQTRIVAFGYDFSQYDVAPDGRFLITSLPANSSSPLTLVTGWTSLLKEP